MPSAMHRPWMPALGNHEVEAGNGPLGYNSYHARYTLPGNGTPFAGNWYRYQVGSVLFISLDNNDVVYENDGGLDPTTNQALYILGLQPRTAAGLAAADPGAGERGPGRRLDRGLVPPARDVDLVQRQRQ
jgi:hypothetical protein